MTSTALRRVLPPLAFLVVFLLAWFWLPEGLDRVARSIRDPESVILWWSVRQFGAPLLFAVLAAVLVRRRLLLALPATSLSDPVASPSRTVLFLRRGVGWLLGLGYFLTAVRGIPAVHNLLEERAQHSYSESRVLSTPPSSVRGPRLRFGCDIPVLPGLLFSYSEEYFTRSYNSGGWTLFLWAGGQPFLLMYFPVWRT